MSSLWLKQATSNTKLYTVNHPVHGTFIVMVYVDNILGVSDFIKWMKTLGKAGHRRAIPHEELR
jgi:hypothetical protein